MTRLTRFDKLDEAEVDRIQANRTGPGADAAEPEVLDFDLVDP